MTPLDRNLKPLENSKSEEVNLDDVKFRLNRERGGGDGKIKKYEKRFLTVTTQMWSS